MIDHIFYHFSTIEVIMFIRVLIIHFNETEMKTIRLKIKFNQESYDLIELNNTG